jgi:chromosome segregation protein
MRLRALDLLRYGHLSDAALSFPDDVRLHVVHGANEAGKSTALAAIADALFGFGHRTDFDFLHGAPNLRVGFTLSARDGAAASFIRRKGRRDTLRDVSDEAVPDDSLRRFLGGASRDLFERSFGLDGARLREGGRELLRLGGEVGESLLAGAGLLNLRAALARLDEDAKSLVGDGRGRRRLSDAVDAWRRAQRESEERVVAPRAWQEAATAHATAVAELVAVQGQIRALVEENSRFQRMRRVAPLLAQLGDARESLKQLADAPHLPADAEGQFHALVAAQRDAARDRAREDADVQRLTAERAALPQDGAVIALQDAIDALMSQRAIAVQAVNDLPQVQTNAANFRAKVNDAVRVLGLSLEPEAARDAQPTDAALRAVQRLIKQHAALAADVGSAARAMAAGQRSRNQAAQALAVSSEPVSPDVLRRTIDAARAEGPLDRELLRVQRALAAAEDNVAATLAALPLWRSDLETLVACPLPLQAETAVIGATFETTRDQLAAVREEVGHLTAQIAGLEREVSEFSARETVPTPDAVAEVRAARDRVWRAIRRRQEKGSAGDDEDEDVLPEGHLPDVFETLRDQADRLADRRADEAQRVADFLLATDRLNRAREQRNTAENTRRVAEAAATDAEAMWRALWAPTELEPLAPSAMLEWRRARADILRLAEDAADVRRQRDDLAARRALARSGLADLLPEMPPQENLSAVLLRAETACAAVEAKLAEHVNRKNTLREVEGRLPELQQSVDVAAAAMDAWRQDWSKAVAVLGLPAGTSIETAEAALEAWARIAEAGPAWRTDEHRIAAMNGSIDAYRTEVGAVVAQLGDAATDEAAPVVAARLVRRLAAARKAAADADELMKQIVAHQQAATDATNALAVADADLETLRQMADVTDNPALEQAIARARQRDAAVEAIARTEQALSRQSDGMSEAALLAETTGIDLDAVVGRLAEIETQLATLGERREELSAQRTRAAVMLTELSEGHDAAAMAQQAEDALAVARDAAERYARLHVARVLLRSGIDRFRKEQQGPLLRAAGRYFALLTNSRYERLIIDYDASDRPVLVAVRDIGTECPVEALSEGARDQLYLALRVAAVQAYAAQAEPLPFIADDLLVHFDDTRAAAAIALLAELGRTTQVILFTHHDHIVGLAERQDGVGIQNLPPIVSYATAMPANV